MVKLYLPWTGLRGEIPACIGDLTHLEYFGVYGNGLRGPFPKSIGNLTHLEYFNVGWNGLSGPIPESIGDLTHLEYFSFWGNDLSGPIAASIGNLTHLKVFNAWGNDLNGPIPGSIGNLIHIEYFNVANNEFSDTLDFLSGSSSLKNLVFTNNDFYGPIPSFLTELCEKETMLCKFANNKRLCGDVERGENSIAELNTLSILD